MTCIVAIKNKNDDIYIGADSAGTDDETSLIVLKNPKIFKNGNFIFGCCGSIRMAQLLRFSFKPPEQNVEDVYEYMCTIFIDVLRKCLSDGGLIQVKDNVEEIKDSKFIVGYKSRLFIVDEDLQVDELCFNYVSIGSGEDIAYGSLYTSEGRIHSEMKRMELALEAAEMFNSAVRKPFVFDVLEVTK